MTDTIKQLIKQLQESAVIQFFYRIREWCQENVVKRKLITFSFLLAAWISLLLGAIFSPQRQTFTTDQLATKRVFENGTGEISLVKQIYSPKTGVIVLQFETTDSTSSIARGIDSKKLNWKLYAQHKSSDTSMEVIPITDKKISVIIKNIPKGFGAFAIDIKNNRVTTNQIDVDISTPSSSSDDDFKGFKQEDKSSENVVQFFVTPQNKKMEIATVKNISREEFALQEIEEEIGFQKEQMKKLTQSIKKLKELIKDNESSKESLLTEAKYLSGDDLTKNQKDIEQIDSDTETKNRSIETANQNRDILKEKISSLKKKKAAIKDGTFEFSNPIETVEMK